MNLDDKSLFLDAMEDVQPLKRATDVHWHPTRNQRAPQRIDAVDLETHPRLMPPARGCVHHFSPDTKHHQRV